MVRVASSRICSPGLVAVKGEPGRQDMTPHYRGYGRPPREMFVRLEHTADGGTRLPSLPEQEFLSEFYNVTRRDMEVQR